MLYRSANHWLRYAPDGKWIVSNTRDMEENLLGGFCHCSAFGLMDPSFAKSWYVLGDEGLFQNQTQIVATKMSSEEVGFIGRELRRNQEMEQKRKEQQMQQKHKEQAEQKRKDEEMQQKLKKQEMGEKCVGAAAQDKLAVRINFQGATGCSINGVYTRQRNSNVVHPDKIFYRCKPASNNCPSLSYNSSGRWVVMQGSKWLAYCGVAGLPSPCDAKRWYVANSEKAFLEQTVTVTNLDTKQPKISTRPERRSRFPSRRKRQLIRYMREVAGMARVQGKQRQVTVLPSLLGQTTK